LFCNFERKEKKEHNFYKGPQGCRKKQIFVVIVVFAEEEGYYA